MLKWKFQTDWKHDSKGYFSRNWAEKLNIPIMQWYYITYDADTKVLILKFVGYDIRYN